MSAKPETEIDTSRLDALLDALFNPENIIETRVIESREDFRRFHSNIFWSFGSNEELESAKSTNESAVEWIEHTCEEYFDPILVTVETEDGCIELFKAVSFDVCGKQCIHLLSRLYALR